MSAPMQAKASTALPRFRNIIFEGWAAVLNPAHRRGCGERAGFSKSALRTWCKNDSIIFAYL
jgi:hypothetical protein